MTRDCLFVYLSAEHSYILESPSMEFAKRSDQEFDRTVVVDSLNITEFPCLVMLSYGEGTDDNAAATTLPISLLRCDEPEWEYAD